MKYLIETNIKPFLIVSMLLIPVYSYGVGLPYQSVQRPITAAKLFRGCQTSNLKSGVQISSLCNIWDKHILFLENELSKVCGNAGERINKRVKNVRGMYVKIPSGRKFILHSSDRDVASYVSPNLNRRYRFVEVELRKNLIRRYEVNDIKPGKRTARWKSAYSNLDKPTAQFKISFENLTDGKLQSQGLFGNRTIVADRLTKNVLAERAVYYYIIKEGLRLPGGQRLQIPDRYNRRFTYIVPCKNYAPQIIYYEKNHPVSAYEFVSRVLIPEPWSDSERMALYDLTKGVGQIKKKCVSSVSFGPDVTLNNLTARIEKQLWGHLHLGIKGTRDIFTCENHFMGPKWDTKYYFSNGDVLTEKELLSYFNLVWE